MIQLVFDASTAAEALERAPVEVGYSQHEGAERAAWADPKLERLGSAERIRSFTRPTARTRTSSARRSGSGAS